MKIIDFHTHYYPDKIADKVSANMRVAPHIDLTRAALIESMAQNGIDYSLALPLVNTPDNSRGVNRWAVSENSCPVFMAGSIHPCEPDPEETLGYLAAHGIRGIKLHPEYQNVRFDSPLLHPVFARCAELGLFVLTHAGYDINFPPPCRCDPAMLLKTKKLFPKLKIVAAHLGSMYMPGWVMNELAGCGVMFDTAFVTPHTCGKEILTAIIRKNGVDNILFGSDSPWCRPGDVSAMLRSLDLPHEALQKIFHDNAARLLGL